ncbi:hypothetical protein ACLB2K_051886 [Fragaria x ananassa]
MSLSLDFLGGAPFQLLYDGVRVAIGRASKFKTLLINLESTLDCLQPRVIQQIRDHNLELNLPNDVIQDLQVKMDVGVQLIANLSSLSMWNFRVWGDCCNCMKPSYADQLAALDRSLRRLLEILKLEQMRNVVELLRLSRRTNDRLDELERRQLEILKALQETGDMLREQQVVMEKIERNCGASSDRERGSAPAPAPAPALGAAFRILFDVVITVKDKNMKYKRLLEDFESTLECLKPLIEELVESNKLLHLPNGKQEFFIMQMEKGVELIHKCAEVRNGGMRYTRYECTKELMRLDGCLQRLFIELTEQVVWNVKKALVLVSNLEKEITQIEEGGVVHSDESEIKCPVPVPQPPSPSVGVDLQNVQLNQEVIEETLDPVSNFEEEIKEIIEASVVQNDDVQSQSTQLSWRTAGSSIQSMQGKRGVIKERWDSEDEQDVKQSIEAGGVEQIDDLGGEGHRPVEPGLPAVIRDVPQVNMEVSRDVIKEALVDSAKILIDQKWVKSNERSDVEQDQMETAAGLDVLSLQGSMDVETLYSTPVDSALKCATNIDKMGVDKNEGSGESPIEIAVAAETEPPSPTVRDVPRNAKKETAEPHCSSPAKVKQPDKEEKHSEETEMIMQVPFPDECIGNIISLTTPADACRLSLVSKRFKCAAESDQVWENFLPSPHLIHAIESQSTSSSTFVPAKSKKEFYLALCDNSVLMDNEKMSFSLDKWSGKKCYMICARELNIVWAQDKSTYLSWISLAESRFKEVASLDEVCWLEIRGKIDTSILSPWTLYKAYLVYKLTEDAYGFDVPVEVAIAERHYGFEYGPLDAALGGDENKQTVYLDPSLEIMDGARRPNERADGWLEMKLGEFLCQAEEDGELEMICAEYKDLCWKSGLIVQGIEVRPERKEYSEAKGKAGHFRAKGKKALFF